MWSGLQKNKRVLHQHFLLKTKELKNCQIVTDKQSLLRCIRALSHTHTPNMTTCFTSPEELNRQKATKKKIRQSQDQMWTCDSVSCDSVYSPVTVPLTFPASDPSLPLAPLCSSLFVFASLSLSLPFSLSLSLSWILFYSSSLLTPPDPFPRLLLSGLSLLLSGTLFLWHCEQVSRML